MCVGGVHPAVGEQPPGLAPPSARRPLQRRTYIRRAPHVDAHLWDIHMLNYTTLASAKRIARHVDINDAYHDNNHTENKIRRFEGGNNLVFPFLGPRFRLVVSELSRERTFRLILWRSAHGECETGLQPRLVCGCGQQAAALTGAAGGAAGGASFVPLLVLEPGARRRRQGRVYGHRLVDSVQSRPVAARLLSHLVARGTLSSSPSDTTRSRAVASTPCPTAAAETNMVSVSQAASNL